MRSTLAHFMLFTIVCVLMVSSCGCYRVRSEELYGRYTLTADWGKAELVLLEQGKLEEIVTDRSGRHTINGTWRLVSAYTLERKPCFLFDYDGLQGKLDSCSGHAQRYRDGHVGIDLDPDAYLAYEK